ncbi:MAG TPA: phosphotransferase, partial [Rhizomicrobium sp.]|nr:phosphotransferase [Rhizomicrobium sp.]
MTAALRHRAAEALHLQAPAPLEPTERQLSGHSGARVVLHSNGQDSFVRKTAANAAASARLKAQADKQHAFWMFGLPFPKIRAQNVDAAGIGSFDMNYIPGRTIADAVMNSGAFDPLAVVKAAERLMWLFSAQRGAPIEAQIFKAKILEATRRMVRQTEDARLLEAMRTSGERLLRQDWSGIPETPSHGDLTLENILLTAGKSIAFIDCDDGFASSFWLDFGKLFQDIDGHWCIRALYAPGAEPVRKLNASQKLENLGLHFRGLAAQMDSGLPSRLPQLAALGLFRAIPYAHSDL